MNNRLRFYDPFILKDLEISVCSMIVKAISSDIFRYLPIFSDIFRYLPIFSSLQTTFLLGSKLLFLTVDVLSKTKEAPSFSQISNCLTINIDIKRLGLVVVATIITNKQVYFRFFFRRMNINDVATFSQNIVPTLIQGFLFSLTSS
jgi:hypothetical protein